MVVVRSLWQWNGGVMVVEVMDMMVVIMVVLVTVMEVMVVVQMVVVMMVEEMIMAASVLKIAMPFTF